MTDIDKFLADHTFECKPMHARISRRQCGTNIKTGEMPQCANCPQRHRADLETPKQSVPWFKRGFRHGKPEGVTAPERTVITQADVARCAGVSRGILSYVLGRMIEGCAKLPVHTEKVKAAMEKLGVTIDELKLTMKVCPPLRAYDNAPQGAEKAKRETIVKHKKQYSQSDVAKAAGVHSGMVGYVLRRIAQGKPHLPPSAVKIKAAMESMGITFDDLKHTLLTKPRKRKAAPKVEAAASTPEIPTLQIAVPTQDELPDQAVSSTKKRIYLGAPYSDPEHAVRCDRYRAVTEMAAKLTEEGHLVYSPISHGHAFGMLSLLPGDWIFWSEHCLSFLHHWAQEFHVLALPGWRESIGLAAEMAEAEKLKMATKLYF